ncbi:MAG TPA: hypothetical protein VII56_02340 [Rhizomicrobium sp.]
MDWTKILNDAIAAAKTALGNEDWSAVAKGAATQIGKLVVTAQYIAEHKDQMDPAEYQFTVAQNKTALHNVFTAYEAIGEAAAQNAIAAVVKAVVADVPALAGIL